MDFHFIEKRSLWSRTLNSHLEPCCYVTTVCLKPSPQKHHNKIQEPGYQRWFQKQLGICVGIPGLHGEVWMTISFFSISTLNALENDDKEPLSHPLSWALTKGESLGALVPCPFELMPSHFQRKDKIFYEGSLFLPGKVFLLRTF